MIQKGKRKDNRILNIIVFGLLTPSIIIIFIFRPYILCSSNSYKNDQFEIYSDKIIPSNIKNVLSNIDRKEIKDDKVNFKVFICENKMRYNILALTAYNALGFTSIISGFVIIAPSNIEENQIIPNKKTNNIRSLSSVIGHEITHKVIKKRYGLFKTLTMPKWKKEGYCEYVARASSFGFQKGLKLFINGESHDSYSFDYFKYRLYVLYLMDYRKLSFAKIVKSSFDIKELEKEILDNINNGNYVPLED